MGVEYSLGGAYSGGVSIVCDDECSVGVTIVCGDERSVGGEYSVGVSIVWFLSVMCRVSIVLG